MRQILLSALAVLSLSSGASAQMPYNFRAFNQAYVPLDSATLVDSGYAWNSNDLMAMPIGFPFRIDTINCSYYFSEGGASFLTDTANTTVSGFIMTSASLDDRGYSIDSVSHSPIRYKVTGPVGNRIFKSEFFNAGFDQQLQNYGVMTDSVNLQVWLYEDSDAVEMRYGPSLISDPTYFSPINFAGYGQDIDTNGNGKIYVLNGNPANPTLQTVALLNGNPATIFAGLSAFPPSGTVYRFSRKAGTGISNVPDAEQVVVYPTICSNEVMIKYTGTDKLDYNVIAVNGADMKLTGSLDKGLEHLDVSNLPAGMYLLHVQNASGSKVYKFVKQ